MSFETIKQQYLKKIEDTLHSHQPDNSKKGFVDEEILDLITLINSNEHYYTTSSCAGRIVILQRNNNNKKNESAWLFSSHKAVKSIPPKVINTIKDDCWLKFEPCILHVCCKELESAIAFVDLGKKVGFKRGGIASISKDNRIIVEITGVDRIDVPIANNKGMLVNEEYLQFLVEECNKKMKINNERIQKLYDLIKKIA